MNALERREQIIERMKIRKFDTAFALAHEFGVTERTIRSDIQELSCSGYPIQADTGRYGGIRWTGSKKQFPFNEKEACALRWAIENAPLEHRLALESLLCDNTKVGRDVQNKDIYELLDPGKSQASLAGELGITPAMFSLIISGKRKPSAGLAERILKLKEAGGGKIEGNQGGRRN